MPPVRESFRRSQIAIGALFCFLGFQYGTWVSRVPQLQSRLDLNAAEVGLLLLAPGVGAAVSFPLVSSLMRRLGSRTLALSAALSLLVVLVALAAVSTFATAVVVLFADGVLIACLNVAMNSQGAALEARYQRNTMARLHAVFSGGTLAAALLAAGVTTVSESLALHFGVAVLVLLGLVAVSRGGTLRTDAPAAPVDPATAPAAAEPVAERGRRWVLPSMVTIGLSTAMVLAELTEGAMNDWSALYLRDVALAGPGITPLGVAVVSAVMLVARLFADGWRERWGDKRVVVTGSLLAACGLGGALLAGGVVPALVGFGCVGLGMAAVAPCIYVAAARVGPGTLSLVASMGTVGLLAGPPVIGLVAHATDLVWGMSVVVGSTALLAVWVLALRWPVTDRPGPAAPADEEAASRPN